MNDGFSVFIGLVVRATCKSGWGRSWPIILLRAVPLLIVAGFFSAAAASETKNALKVVGIGVVVAFVWAAVASFYLVWRDERMAHMTAVGTLTRATNAEREVRSRLEVKPSNDAILAALDAREIKLGVGAQAIDGVEFVRRYKTILTAPITAKKLALPAFVWVAAES